LPRETVQTNVLLDGEKIADVMSNAIASSIDAVSNGIWNVIDGTMTWGQLFLQVGRQIISQLIAIVIQETIVASIRKALATSWSAFQSSLRAKDVVEANATELAKTPLLATNATLASISSFGVAAIIGIALIAGILAAVGGFQEGGIVQGGGPQLIKVNEDGRPEAVLNARAVSILGPERIAAMNAGIVDFENRVAKDLEPTTTIGTFGSVMHEQRGMTQTSVDQEEKEIKINLILVDSRNAQAARDFALSSEGRTVIAEVVREQRLEIGV